MKIAPNMFDDVVECAFGPAQVDLRRIDPSMNMRRFHRMSLQPDLFGGVDLIREWGRIGRRGQFLVEQHSDEPQAVAAMLALERIKRKRGYNRG